MYGWRAQIGLILPSGNTVTEPEFNTYVPDGVSVHTARIQLTGGDTDALAESESDIDRCVELLAGADVDLITYACTMGSVLSSPWDLEEKIEESTGIPTVATGASVKRALEHLDVKNVAVTTPYIDELNELEREYLTDAGYEVTDISGLGAETAQEMATYSVERMYSEAKAIDSDEADAVLVTCMNYRTFAALEQLEKDLDKPVLSSNQVTLWDSLRTLDIDYEGVQLGTLFDNR